MGVFGDFWGFLLFLEGFLSCSPLYNRTLIARIDRLSLLTAPPMGQMLFVIHIITSPYLRTTNIESTYNSSAILKLKRIQKLKESSSYLSYHNIVTLKSHRS